MDLCRALSNDQLLRDNDEAYALREPFMKSC